MAADMTYWLGEQLRALKKAGDTGCVATTRRLSDETFAVFESLFSDR